MEEKMDAESMGITPQVEADSHPMQTEVPEVEDELPVNEVMPSQSELDGTNNDSNNEIQCTVLGAEAATEMEGSDNEVPTTEDSTQGETIAQDPLKSSSKDEETLPTIYNIKWIQFYELLTPIVTQNENGPCPLIAIFNVLLLSRKIILETRLTLITAQQIISRIAELIWESIPKELTDDDRINYEQNISDAMSVFPNLMTGLDVNVKFYTVNSFEYTKELAVFDLLRIPVYHGWLIDPQDAQAVSVIGSRSYNQIVEMIITKKSSSNAEDIEAALIAEQFLQSTASQLTCHGIVSLCEEMAPGSLAVLFRNNHFSTLHRRETELFTLVTDLGFLNESNVVWETLSGIQGDSHFVDGLFMNSPLKSLVTVDESYEPVTDYDRQIALSLQQQENEANLPGPSTGSNPYPSDYELAKRLQEEENIKVRAQSSSRNRTKPHPSSSRAPVRPPEGHSSSRRPVSAQPQAADNKCIIL